MPGYISISTFILFISLLTVWNIALQVFLYLILPGLRSKRKPREKNRRR